MDTSTVIVWLAIVGIAILGVVIPAVVFRLPSSKPWLRGWFRKMGERRVVALNDSVQTMRKATLWPQYLAPIPFIVLAFVSHSAGRQKLFLELAGCVFFASIVLRSFLRELERITTLEMEYRTFRKVIRKHQSAKSEQIQ